MDLTFRNEAGIFNYRACGLLIQEGKLLVMKDARSPYYYLPGGRVKLGERAEDAVLREIREELGIECRIERPLWLNQAFFEEDVTHENFHELCLYFLMDISGTDLMDRGIKFDGPETHNSQRFTWLPVESLKGEYLYPLFLKEEIVNLPEHLTLRTEVE